MVLALNHKSNTHGQQCTNWHIELEKGIQDRNKHYEHQFITSPKPPGKIQTCHKIHLLHRRLSFHMLGSANLVFGARNILVTQWNMLAWCDKHVLLITYSRVLRVVRNIISLLESARYVKEVCYNWTTRMLWLKTKHIYNLNTRQNLM